MQQFTPEIVFNSFKSINGATYTHEIKTQLKWWMRGVKHTIKMEDNGTFTHTFTWPNKENLKTLTGKGESSSDYLKEALKLEQDKK